MAMWVLGFLFAGAGSPSASPFARRATASQEPAGVTLGATPPATRKGRAAERGRILIALRAGSAPHRRFPIRHPVSAKTAGHPWPAPFGLFPVGRLACATGPEGDPRRLFHTLRCHVGRAHRPLAGGSIIQLSSVSCLSWEPLQRRWGLANNWPAAAGSPLKRLPQGEIAPTRKKGLPHLALPSTHLSARK